MAQPEYRLVFDLAQAPSPWPGIATLFVIGVALVAVAIAFVLLLRGNFGRRPKPENRSTIWGFAIFAAIAAAVMLFGGFHQRARERALQAAVHNGALKTIEGCLTGFNPGQGSGARGDSSSERWRIAGQTFRYGSGDMGSAFHHTELEGGPVHRDSRVRVAFVPDRFTGGVAIVRLEVQDRACPAAPDLTY